MRCRIDLRRVLLGGLTLPLGWLLMLAGAAQADFIGWIPTGSMAVARSGHTAMLLQNGKVLVAGGTSGGYLSSAELYFPYLPSCDFDGDRETDIGVWRPGDGTWSVLRSMEGYDQTKYKTYKWGGATDKPITCVR